MRGGAPTPPGGSGGPGYSLRPNGYATVSGGGQTLGTAPASPVAATRLGSGRPVPTLQTVTMQLAGEAGALRRGSFTFTCYNFADFDSYLKGIANPKTEITMTIGSHGASGGAKSFKLTVYKHSFTSSKDGKYTITVSAVGRGLELLKKDGLSVSYNPGLIKGKKFVTNYDFFNDEVEVRGTLDYMMWELQDALQLNDSFTFSPEHGDGIPGKFFTLIAPSNWAAPPGVTGQNNGLWTRNRLVYFTLQYLIEVMNKFLAGSIPDARTPQILIKATTPTTITVNGAKVQLISGDPSTVIIPRSGDLSDYVIEQGMSISSLIDFLLGTPSGIIMTGVDVTPMDADANVGLICLSYDALRSIESRATTDAENADSALMRAIQGKQSKLNVDDFLKGVFSIIREATGGKIDLEVMEDPGAFDSGGSVVADLWIVNKNQKPDTVSPVSYDDISGEGGVREATITGDVPQAWQAEAFANGSLPGETEKPATSKVTSADVQNAKIDLAKSGFDSAQSGALKSLLRSAHEGGNQQDLSQDRTKPYPIKLNLTLNGVHGIGFGHLITIASLGGRWGKGSGVGFTVTEVTHTVSGQDWTTEVTSVARIIG